MASSSRRRACSACRAACTSALTSRCMPTRPPSDRRRSNTRSQRPSTCTIGAAPPGERRDASGWRSRLDVADSSGRPPARVVGTHDVAEGRTLVQHAAHEGEHLAGVRAGQQQTVVGVVQGEGQGQQVERLLQSSLPAFDLLARLLQRLTLLDELGDVHAVGHHAAVGQIALGDPAPAAVGHAAQQRTTRLAVTRHALSDPGALPARGLGYLDRDGRRRLQQVLVSFAHLKRPVQRGIELFDSRRSRRARGRRRRAPEARCPGRRR
jgi:hypothetical protein